MLLEIEGPRGTECTAGEGKLVVDMLPGVPAVEGVSTRGIPFVWFWLVFDGREQTLVVAHDTRKLVDYLMSFACASICTWLGRAHTLLSSRVVEVPESRVYEHRLPRSLARDTPIIPAEEASLFLRRWTASAPLLEVSCCFTWERGRTYGSSWRERSPHSRYRPSVNRHNQVSLCSPFSVEVFLWS